LPARFFVINPRWLAAIAGVPARRLLHNRTGNLVEIPRRQFYFPCVNPAIHLFCRPRARDCAGHTGQLSA
jgi:hypothetical protein